MKTFKQLNALFTSLAFTSLAALPTIAETENQSLSMVAPKPPLAKTVGLTPIKVLKKVAKHTQIERKSVRSPASTTTRTAETAEAKNTSTNEPKSTKHSRVSRSQNKKQNSSQTNPSASKKSVETYLKEGKLAEGERELFLELQNHPEDDNLRFGLGIVQFLGGVQKLSQDLYRLGLKDSFFNLPFLRINIPRNPNPEIMSYTKAQAMMEGLNDKLLQSAETLGQIKDDNVKVPLHFGMIKLDLDGDGKISDGETLWRVYSHLTRNSHIKPEEAEKFQISFDRGDVHWLKGYCHLLSSMCEIYLAHDTKESFDHSAHIFFEKVDTPYPFLAQHSNKLTEIRNISDAIAFIHLINWEVVKPERMEAALHDLEEVVAQSRISWKYIMAETDNDCEWLPNPDQDCVMPDIKVSKEMVDSWGHIMNETDLILKGERLIPFWRTAKPNAWDDDAVTNKAEAIPAITGTGVNVRNVFLKPRRLDLVLWVQGTAAAPYLEQGKLTQGYEWRSWRSTFGSSFPGFALYFN